MTDLEITKTLRDHLIRYWNIAPGWIDSPTVYGVPCMILRLSQLTGSSPDEAKAYMRRVFNEDTYKPIFPSGGLRPLLGRLDRAIARLEEHDVPSVPELVEA